MSTGARAGTNNCEKRDKNGHRTNDKRIDSDLQLIRLSSVSVRLSPFHQMLLLRVPRSRTALYTPRA